MTSIKVELTPEVAAVLGTLLMDGMSLTYSDTLVHMDCSLIRYYQDKLEHLAEELTSQGPDIREVMAVHPSVVVQAPVQAA